MVILEFHKYELNPLTNRRIKALGVSKMDCFDKVDHLDRIEGDRLFMDNVKTLATNWLKTNFGYVNITVTYPDKTKAELYVKVSNKEKFIAECLTKGILVHILGDDYNETTK